MKSLTEFLSDVDTTLSGLFYGQQTTNLLCTALANHQLYIIMHNFRRKKSNRCKRSTTHRTKIISRSNKMHIFYVTELTFTVNTTTTTHSDYIPNSTYLSWMAMASIQCLRGVIVERNPRRQILCKKHVRSTNKTRVRISNQTHSKRIM